jgi:hypothetical protein
MPNCNLAEAGVARQLFGSAPGTDMSRYLLSSGSRDAHPRPSSYIKSTFNFPSTPPQNFDRTAISFKTSPSQELLHIYNLHLAGESGVPVRFHRAPSVPVLLFACHRLWFSLHAQLNYENFDKTAIPLTNSLSQELLHIAFSPLASPQVPRALFHRAPSVPVLWFAYDS